MALARFCRISDIECAAAAAKTAAFRGAVLSLEPHASSRAVSLMKTVVVTGAAGLVGQNLIPRLKARGYAVIGIDKHPTNIQRLRELHPDIMVIEEDLSEAGPWMDAFAADAARCGVPAEQRHDERFDW